MSVPPESLSSRLPAWTRIPPQQLLALLLVVATAIALMAGGWMWSTAPDYKVLYANLSDRDGGAVISSLTQMNIPYKFAESGGALLVPAEHVHDVRLRLAAQGLPKGGITGFEITDNPRFGQSQFAEQLSYQRGLEGELSRTIQAIQSVQTARVHLALSRGSAFLREQAKPSASVFVHLYPGRTLDPTHVTAIVHLVSASVPDLAIKNVTVVDQHGALLSGEGSTAPGGLETKQLKYRHETEQSYVKRIESILGPLLGANNVKAQVSAELDFSEVEQAEEIYKPNQKPEDAAVRAQQSSEMGSAAANRGSGVPGALTNQPPPQATAPVVAPPGAEQNAGGAAGATAANQRRDSTVSYEVDKSIRHTRISQGRMKRLSVAVVINDRKLTDAAGKTTSKPLSDAEKTQITELVKGVMGYDEKRGDTVSVINSAFTLAPVEKIVDVPVWKDPSTLAMAKDAGRYLLIAAFVLFLVFKVLRPMVRNLARPPELAGPEVPLLAGPDGAPGATTPADRYGTSVQNARQIAKQDPKAVANVVKNWVGND